MSMVFDRRRFLGAAALATFAHSAALAAGKNDTITFGLSSFPPNLKPWDQAGTAAGTVKLLVHRGLLSFGPDGNLRGELAESWQQDGTNSWVFKLRDARFHDGAPVTAQDVQWCIQQMAAATSTAIYRAEMQAITAVETPDARTVVLRTASANATLPLLFASYNMPIIKAGSGLTTPVGAGPYRIAATERGASLTLEAVDSYYRPGLPKTKTLKLVVYADENLRVAALDAGNVDIIEYVPWSAMQAISTNPALALDAVDGPFMSLLFNGAKAPFNDKRVRKAIAHAIRREEIVNAAFFGFGSPLAHLPISESSPYFNADLANGWAYNPDLSRKLLAEAGLSGGLKINLLSTGQYRMLKDTAEIVQRHLAEVNIIADLQLPDWASRVQLASRGQFDVAVHGTAADTNDPDSLTAIVDGSLSPSISRSYMLDIPKITALLNAGRAEFDPAKRKAIYHEMEKVAIDEVPLVGLCFRKQAYAMKKSLTGFTNLPGQLTFSSGITLEQVVSG